MGDIHTQKKIALINDLSGYGRCSLTVQIPVISAMGVQTCPVPTGIFSNHTGYKSFVKQDMTGFLDIYIDEWDKLEIKFDGICIGYLTSPAQVGIVERIIRELKKPGGVVILDPVMGDDGDLYKGYSKETADELLKLVRYADILTPNVTELFYLTGHDYKKDITEDECMKLCGGLCAQGPDKIVVTGIPMDKNIGNFCYESGKTDKTEKATKKVVSRPMLGHQRPGTGDVFCAVVAADAVKGEKLQSSVEKASDLISRCIKRSDEMGIPPSDGLCFEEFLRLV